MFAHNVSANLRLTSAVVKKMIKQAEEEENEGPAGSIVNLTSIASNRTLPGLTGFSTVSAALDQLTRSLAVSFAQHNIRVNGIAIGSVMSATLRDSLQDNKELRDMLIAATPAGRIAEADEAAEAAVFLASNQASFITGQILAIDGGRSASASSGLASSILKFSMPSMFDGRRGSVGAAKDWSVFISVMDSSRMALMVGFVVPTSLEI